MKPHSLPWSLAAVLAATCVIARAAINFETDGSDGDLILTNSGAPREVVIDLSKARDGAWNSPQTPPFDPVLGGVGTYDGDKWAVVFKYKSVRIEKDVTLRFVNHVSRAPVVWLVQGDVAIEGAIILDGQYRPYERTAEPAPGGFRASGGDYRGFLFVDGLRLPSSLIPLMGGSAGFQDGGAYSGAWSGGGALLLASRGTIRLTGRLSAIGPAHANGRRHMGGGGSIRIVANTLTLEEGHFIDTRGAPDQDGVPRFEAVHFSGHVNSVIAPTTGELSEGATVKLWPGDADPSVRIVSVENVQAPAKPLALTDPGAGSNGQLLGADMTIRKLGKSRILIETSNFPPSGDAKVILFATSNEKVINNENGNPAGLFGFRASLQTDPEPTPAKAQWLVEVELPQGYTSLQVHAVAAP